MAKTVSDLFREFTDTHRFLDSMSPEQKARLAAHASVRKFPHRKLIAAIGEPVEGIYFIIEGGLRLESFSEDGERFLVGDFQAGDVFGFLAVLDQKGSIHDASAIGDTTCIFISASHFRSFIYSDPDLLRHTTEMMCQRLRMALLMVARFAPGSQTSRVVRCLLANVDQLGYRPTTENRAQVAINQFDLAAMLSISRQSVHRVLKDLEAQGIVSVGYNVIDICDVERLRRVR